MTTDNSLLAIITMLNKKNSREKAHCVRVSRLCADLGKAIGLTAVEITELRLAGLLHDVGKIGVDNQILDKPGRLGEKEYEEMKKHAEIGYNLLSGIEEYENLSEYVLFHHEKVDGTGYPRRLKDKDIPLQARIIAIADSFDAMTAGRPYQAGINDGEALAELYRCAGTQFDKALVDAFKNSRH